jgi:hypothetical protein
MTEEQQKPKRPRTERQIEASRANGAKSRGPKTIEAKQRTKYNALTHGAHSNEVLLPNEDEAQYEALRTAVLSEYNPQTALEADMAEQIFTALWKRRRYQAMQQALWKQSMHGALKEKQEEGQLEADPEALPATEHLLNEAARWCHRNGDSYAQLDALENRARLAFARAQRNWRQYKKDTQQDKATEEAQEALAAQLLDAISAADFANQTHPEKAA